MTCCEDSRKKLLVLVLSLTMLLGFNVRVLGAEEGVVSAYLISDASTLENGNIAQKFKLIGNVERANDEPNEVGVVYSELDQTPQLEENDVIKIPSDFQDTSQLLALSGELKDETTYYARLYAVFPGQTVYSEVLTYMTANKVRPGEQMGCSNLVSGGNYFIDNGTVDRASSYIALIESGFTAEYAGDSFDGDSNNLVVNFRREGDHSLFTMDKSTNKRYLHVVNLNFAQRPVVVNLSEVSDAADADSGSSYFNAQGGYRFNEENHIQEAGIIFSEEFCSLEIGEDGVHKQSGLRSSDNNTAEGSFTVVREAVNGSGFYYIRSYVKADGRYYYSDQVIPFVVSPENNHGQAGAVIPIDNLGKTQTYSFSVAPNCTTQIGDHIYTSTTGQGITLDSEGIYYLLNTGSNGDQRITCVEVDHTPPPVENVGNNGVYNSAVLPTCAEYNAIFYLAKNGGAEKEFASGIKISENGGYTLKVIDSVGNSRSYDFEIKPPLVTTQECFSVRTHSAEVSANFENNGSVLERGFVYSALNNTPLLGDMGCSVFVPQEDPQPGYLTTTLTDLALNTRYFFRAFIKTGDSDNPSITYGAIKEFTTANLSLPSVVINYPSDITTGTLTIHAKVMDDGGAEVSRRGIVYSTGQNPTVGGADCIALEAGSGGAGDYALTITGLLRDTTYYIRAFATNSQGTGDSGYDFVLRTLSTSAAPTLELISVDSITKNSAIISCNVTSNGGGAITEQGILYSRSEDPTLESEEQGFAAKLLGPTAVNSFTLPLTGLSAGTTYYVKGYGINESGTAYSEQLTFTTTADINNLSLEMVPATPTNGDVTITITYPDFAQQKKYKVDSGELKDYTGPITVTANCSVFALYTNQNGGWSAPEKLEITNIDRIAPAQPLVTFTRPTLAYTSLMMKIQAGTDSESGVFNQSGADYVEFKYGAEGTWERYNEPAESAGLSVPQDTQIFARTVDKAGNISRENVVRKQIRGISLTRQDNQTTIKHGIHIQESLGRENSTIKTISLKDSIESGEFDQYVSYPYGSTYKGCGVKAAQIFSNWFGFDLTQGQVENYVETTDMTLFIDIASLGVNWLFDLVDPGIFSTPAELDSGLQAILNERYNGYIVERHSPNTKSGAISMIESFLSHGYPVIMLVNDGAHWQVITQSSITRDQDGTITDAYFLVHDNGGAKIRTWSELDYYFEDNFAAEAARYADYTSYKDTIMSIRYEEVYYYDNWSSNWTTAKVYETQNGLGESSQYLFLLKRNSGLVHINKVHDNGTIGPVVASYNWSAGWDQVSFYRENGSTYLVMLKSSNGTLHIHKMNPDGTVGELTEDSSLPGIRDNYILLSLGETVTVNQENYLLVRKKNIAAKYYITYLYSFTPGGKLGSPMNHIYTRYTGDSDSLWNSSTVYQAGGQDYLLQANSQTGQVRIHGIDGLAHIQDTVLAGYEWSEGWTKFKPFTVNGEAFLLIAKSGLEGFPTGTADPDGLVRIHRINEDGTIGPMCDDAYWETVSPFIQGTFGFDKTDIYQTDLGLVFLFALRSHDGIVKTLRLSEQNGWVRVKSNLNY